MSNSDADGDTDEPKLPPPPLRPPPERVFGDWERIGDMRPACGVDPVGEWPDARVSSTVSRNATCLEGVATMPGCFALLVGEMAGAALVLPPGEYSAPSDCDDRQASIGSSNLPLDCAMQEREIGLHVLQAPSRWSRVASAFACTPLGSNTILASAATPKRCIMLRV